MIIIKPKTQIGLINSLINRIGIPNHQTKKLYTSVVLAKSNDNTWALYHFKEILEVVSPNDDIEITESDLDRLDNIAKILENFGMIEPLEGIDYVPEAGVRILKKTDIQPLGEWEIVKKFTTSPQKMERFFELQSKLGE